jgi:tripartite-type tricarboxylate transporter receptor subunit TctC
MAAVPAGTPKPIIDRLNAEIAKALPAADVREKLAAMGALPVGSKPEAASAFLRVEVDKWGKVIKTANIKLD